MSNFQCEKCGENILEDENGYYVTGCSHYPLENLNKELNEPITDKEFNDLIWETLLKEKK